MSIFISHKRQDSELAKKIYYQLRDMSIQVYLDNMDKDIETASDLTQHILDHLNKCTHMIAVFSTRTKESWWVPFEIGAALNTGRRIASYQHDNIELPEYMRPWPELKTPEHVALYGEMYRQDQAVVANEGYILESADMKAHVAASRQHIFEGQKKFHEDLTREIKLHSNRR